MAPRKAKKAKTAASWDEVMDPSGDLTLVVGEEKVKLRCARNILILSSPVLKRMLDPESPFMEGNVTDVSDDGTKHINLPEDEPEPLSLVLRIIHHKTEDVPSKVPLDLLVELAILSDKYDLLCCIGQWTSSWCDGYTDQDARAWLFVGFVFKNPEAFRKASKSLILNGTLSDRKLFDTKTEIDGVPSWVLRKIRSCHRAILDQFIKHSLSIASKFMSTQPGMCRATGDTVEAKRLCDAAILGDLTRCYRSIITLQVNDISTYVTHDRESITSYVKRLKKLDGSGKFIAYREEDQTLDHSDCDLSQWLLPYFQRTLNSVRGLGLVETKPFYICVKALDFRTFTLVVCGTDTIAMIKDKIRAQEGVSFEQQKLTRDQFNELEDGLTVADYGLEDLSTLYLRFRRQYFEFGVDTSRPCCASDHAAQHRESEDTSDKAQSDESDEGDESDESDEGDESDESDEGDESDDSVRA